MKNTISLYKWIPILVSILALSLAYQNCSQSLTETTGSGGGDSEDCRDAGTESCIQGGESDIEIAILSSPTQVATPESIPMNANPFYFLATNITESTELFLDFSDGNTNFASPEEISCFSSNPNLVRLDCFRLENFDENLVPRNETSAGISMLRYPCPFSNSSCDPAHSMYQFYGLRVRYGAKDPVTGAMVSTTTRIQAPHESGGITEVLAWFSIDGEGIQRVGEVGQYLPALFIGANHAQSFFYQVYVPNLSEDVQYCMKRHTGISENPVQEVPPASDCLEEDWKNLDDLPNDEVQVDSNFKRYSGSFTNFDSNLEGTNHNRAVFYLRNATTQQIIEYATNYVLLIK